MKIALACDHGAYDYKEIVKTYVQELGHEVEDFGTHDISSMDYPDTVYPAAKSVAKGSNDCGIVLCTTGIGASITANKVVGVRCALVSDIVSAKLTREHNDSNVLALGQGVIGELVMKEIVRIWLETEFSKEEKHQRRIDKVCVIEEKELDER
ncbi:MULTISPECIES: ribose 5-phosphate isomerase B [unclassified Breznakia]|uniref:ribose 5-phosphate isomerase B n=1 Tax=unclassified Breznakia TaxID=2623764 RepID=UPI0024766F9F|nr:MULTISPECIES: ribose 5-phosphate isomerase B [unclassified Breznakia]MDH6367261.1 ribose 5-phosphate isomerase B [Breznakia sp. PH1-1]MDH6404440.1 ribose 5-phosphate isomerase B [Breznakia sp. PF1-11]MDH6412169.1 ribose 5-phosphate isomerase B [Breznakia sp. PFB1-11]MDH6414428.1 ribose 5-phosphate isomerase B [Breznakia sp. PFB1-14]MDH6416813.1 ribose 5-phosphate isomerase B [Breznakia sp. PFB1-4]